MPHPLQARMTRRRCAAALTLFLWLGTGHVPGAEIELASETDPRIPNQETAWTFSPRLKGLWIEALKRPEIDLKRQAADTIARARQMGMEDLADTVPVLTAVLDAPDAHPIVQYAAARALIVLDARASAPVLMKHAANNFDIAQLVEPALARWKFAPMVPVWLARLDEPTTPRSQLVRAMEAAAEVPLEKAGPALLRRALDSNSAPDLRLQSARAVGTIRPQGLEDEARRLAADGAPRVNRLVAAAFLLRHQGEAAEDLLVRLAKDQEPAVATLALRRLLEIQPKRVQPFIAALAANSDGGVRRLAVQALYTLSPQTPALVETLGAMLDDAHIEVRVAAQEALIRLAATATLKPAVLDTAVKMLATEKPRGLEQAILVLGTLREKRVAPRFLVLLDAKHPQVFIAAAWGLRRLAVPETAEVIFRRVKQETDKSRIPLPLSSNIDFVLMNHKYAQLAHLIEMLGVVRYRPAEPLLREYIPKPPVPPPPVEIHVDTVWQPSLRQAAIWSLGSIHEGDPARDLVELLSERVEDEGDSIRSTAAISLGRMKAKTALPALRRLYTPGASSGLDFACGWAIHEITGEALPPPNPARKFNRGGWFLEPLDP